MTERERGRPPAVEVKVGYNELALVCMGGEEQMMVEMEQLLEKLLNLLLPNESQKVLGQCLG